MTIHLPIAVWVLLYTYKKQSPKGGWGCLMSPSCLESQGCHLISHSYLLSSSFFFSFFFFFFFPPSLALLLFLPLIVIFLLMVSWLFFLSRFYCFKGQAFLYGSCWAARRWQLVGGVCSLLPWHWYLPLCINIKKNVLYCVSPFLFFSFFFSLFIV